MAPKSRDKFSGQFEAEDSEPLDRRQFCVRLAKDLRQALAEKPDAVKWARDVLTDAAKKEGII